MTIQQCKYVLEILKMGSFNEASKTLYIAQSSLSSAVKSLESELNIKIFERSNNGVCLTSDGAEFVRYASQIIEQNNLILEKYKSNQSCKKLYIATQHYDFIADIFGKMLNLVNDDAYKISLIETKTYNVINEVESGYCDIGIIAIKNTDFDIMKRILSNKKLNFTSVLKTSPHVFVKNDHPVCNNNILRYSELINYPFVSYEQGKHNVSFFTEEIMENSNVKKHIEISDRASLMNVLLTTDSYTIGTGIMPSTLNEGKIVSIPLESNSYYNIGYILHTDRKCSDLAECFIKMLEELVDRVPKVQKHSI
ncbi:MAG: LysR family transcriptional regulator [Ruminococcaceae bacterium]|nr:LysR family transcriptional regulator [Oscillospiraceae bacterium]